MRVAVKDQRLLPEHAAALSPAARMARFAVLQQRAYELLRASPEGCRRFWQRNLQKRRINVPF
jgi:hypothetical protein